MHLCNQTIELFTKFGRVSINIKSYEIEKRILSTFTIFQTDGTKKDVFTIVVMETTNNK